MVPAAQIRDLKVFERVDRDRLIPGRSVHDLSVHDSSVHDPETRSSEASGELSIRIRQLAREAGFELCGVAPVRNFGELRLFPSWIADGRHGEMKYMEALNDAGDLKRANLANTAPWARSVIVCAINYNTAQPYSTLVEPVDSEGAGWISRYAWCREDYHDAVMRRLRVVESHLREEAYGRPDAQRPTTDDPLQTRA